MISQPVSSSYVCSPLPSATLLNSGLSISWWCLPTSSSFCLDFFPLSTSFWKHYWLILDSSFEEDSGEHEVLVGWFVGALSPVNPKGLHQGWEIWSGKAKDRKAEFQAAGEVCRSISWPTSGFKTENPRQLWILSRAHREGHIQAKQTSSDQRP